MFGDQEVRTSMIIAAMPMSVGMFSYLQFVRIVCFVRVGVFCDNSAQTNGMCSSLQPACSMTGAKLLVCHEEAMFKC